VSSKTIAMKEERREVLRHKKMSEEKLDKKLIKAFERLNNKNCYAFLDDKSNMSHHNLMDFLNLLEKRCEARFGKAKSYKAHDVIWVLSELWGDPTERQIKTFNVINRYLKKEDDPEMLSFKIRKLFKGKEFDKAMEEFQNE
jgi:hypothetical protein